MQEESDYRNALVQITTTLTIIQQYSFPIPPIPLFTGCLGRSSVTAVQLSKHAMVERSVVGNWPVVTMQTTLTGREGEFQAHWDQTEFALPRPPSIRTAAFLQSPTMARALLQCQVGTVKLGKLRALCSSSAGFSSREQINCHICEALPFGAKLCIFSNYMKGFTDHVHCRGMAIFASKEKYWTDGIYDKV